MRRRKVKPKAKRRRPGQPTKYSPPVVRAICAMISRGMDLADSAAALRIHRDTVYAWEAAHPEFSDALSQARAVGKDALLRTIMKAGRKHWAAAAWLMERRFPNEFGRNLRQIVGPSTVIDVPSHPAQTVGVIYLPRDAEPKPPPPDDVIDVTAKES